MIYNLCTWSFDKKKNEIPVFAPTKPPMFWSFAFVCASAAATIPFAPWLSIPNPNKLVSEQGRSLRVLEEAGMESFGLGFYKGRLDWFHKRIYHLLIVHVDDLIVWSVPICGCWFDHWVLVLCLVPADSTCWKYQVCCFVVASCLIDWSVCQLGLKDS